MAEIATIARPYAEALFKAISPQDAAGVAEQVNELAQVAADATLRQFADNPKARTDQVFELVSSVAKRPHGEGTRNGSGRSRPGGARPVTLRTHLRGWWA